MTEAPNGTFAIADFGRSAMYFVQSSGGPANFFSTGLLSPSSVAFFSLDVGYSTCNPAPLASRAFCLSGSSSCPKGAEGVAPGNQSGISVPRYILGASGGLTSPTFFVSNGGTGEILFVDPVQRSQRRIANGFSTATVSNTTRGPEQMAYNVSTKQLFAVDAGRNLVVAIDTGNGQQTTIRSGLNWPFGIVLMANGNLLVSNRGDGMLLEMTQTGAPVATYDTGLGEGALRGLTFSSRGILYLVEDRTQTIYQVDLPKASTNPVNSVNAATLARGNLAANTIASAFGSGFTQSTEAASALPLPTTLAGASVSVGDSTGTSRPAPLFFASPTQINYLVPPGTSSGSATVTYRKSDGSSATEIINVASVAPGLFSADASGAGVPAGSVTRVRADGSQSTEAIARFDSTQNRSVAIPINLGPSGDQVVLVLYGGGIRGRSALAAVQANVGSTPAEVLYAGDQGGFPGLDQLNVRIPRSLAGSGEVDVTLTVDGQTANRLRINIQ